MVSKVASILVSLDSAIEKNLGQILLLVDIGGFRDMLLKIIIKLTDISFSGMSRGSRWQHFLVRVLRNSIQVKLSCCPRGNQPFILVLTLAQVNFKIIFILMGCS